MFSKTFTTEDGQVKTVYADSEDALATAVDGVKAVKAPTYPNINVPLPKGKDLLQVNEDFSVDVADGTGAHNSPRDAVRDDGSLEGNPEVASPGAGEHALKVAGTGEGVGEVPVAEPKESKADSEESTTDSPDRATDSTARDESTARTDSTDATRRAEDTRKADAADRNTGRNVTRTSAPDTSSKK